MTLVRVEPDALANSDRREQAQVRSRAGSGVIDLHIEPAGLPA